MKNRGKGLRKWMKRRRDRGELEGEITQTIRELGCKRKHGIEGREGADDDESTEV